MTAATNVIRTELLNKNNFDTCKIQMEAVLMKMILDCTYIPEENKKPTVITNSYGYAPIKVIRKCESDVRFNTAVQIIRD